MSTPKTKSKTPPKLQLELQAMADGLTTTTLSLVNTLAVLGASLSKAELTAKLKAWIALFTAASQAKQSYVAALAARKAAEPLARLFLTALTTVLKQVLGPTNQGQLAAFGIVAPPPRKVMSVETRAIAKAKRVATRKARGTKGKMQLQSINAKPEPTVQVIGADGQAMSMTMDAPSVSVSTTAPAASPNAAGHTP